MATMTDVAAVAGTSRYTVSKVVNGGSDVREDTRRRILDACRQLHYTPNLNAVNLVRPESRTIGMITPQITDTYFTEVIASAEKAARSAGYQIVHECSYDNPVVEARIIESLKALRVVGIVAAPVVSESNQSLWSQTAKLLPTVYFDRFPHNECHYVVTDNRLSGSLVTRHLLGSGWSVAYLGSSHSITNSAIKLRHLGYEEAVAEACKQPLLIPTDCTKSTNDDFQFGFENMVAYLEHHPQPKALFCATDRIAVGAMRAFSKYGITVGRDVIVAGHDDLDFAGFTTPSLTSVAQAKSEIGQAAIQALLAVKNSGNKLKQRIHKTLKPNLVIRESSVIK